MPIYVYDCLKCSGVVEIITGYDARDDAGPHEGCGGDLVRQQVTRFAQGQAGYQMQAVLNDGTHLKGHFGRDAKRKRKK